MAKQEKLACRISFETTRWKAPSAVIVDLELTNTADQELVQSMSAAFSLSPLASPSELLRSEHTYLALWVLSRGSPLKVPAGETVKRRVDIADLLWSRRNSPLLAHQRLYSEVPKGKYRFSISIDDENGEPLCQTDPREITIDSMPTGRKK